MSRQAARRAFPTAAILFFPSALGAQEPAPQLSAEDVLAQAKAVYTDPVERERLRKIREGRCPPPEPGEEIVVCAPAPDNAEAAGYDAARAEADYAEKTVNKGRSLAPDLGPPPCVPSLLSFCSEGGPVPRPVIIDLAAIPEAPDDSDAAKIARGEKKR